MSYFFSSISKSNDERLTIKFAYKFMLMLDFCEEDSKAEVY